MRSRQAQHAALRRLVLKQLEQDSKRAKLDVGPIFRPGRYDPRLNQSELGRLDRVLIMRLLPDQPQKCNRGRELV
jgi:hypothetical protein